MKLIINIGKSLGLVFLSSLLFTACDKDDDKMDDTIFDTSEPIRTELDEWIYENYTKPYNIAATYLWDDNLVRPDKELFPPKISSVMPALQVVKKIWLDSYSEIGGEDFVKLIAPRQLHLVGSYNVNQNGTIVLGEAGGGARITLFNTDYVNFKNIESIKEFVHTIQHEYIHILNQTKPFDRQAWTNVQVQGGPYTSAWYIQPEAESNELGFVTSYARNNQEEDFAETASFVLLHSEEDLYAFLNGVPQRGRNVIIQKINLVYEYFQEQFTMDFFDLRDVAERNTQAIINGELDE